jgi:hypothetical protein
MLLAVAEAAARLPPPCASQHGFSTSPSDITSSALPSCWPARTNAADLQINWTLQNQGLMQYFPFVH